MARFKIAVGDWSGDGHGKSDDYTVEVPDKFTTEILGANFEKNVADFGFGPSDFAYKYDDSTCSPEKFEVLRDKGFFDLNYDPNDYDDDFDGIFWEQSTKGDYFVGEPEVMAKIVMFYFGYGLEDFSWEFVGEDIPYLLGHYSQVTKTTSVGYGLYY